MKLLSAASALRTRQESRRLGGFSKQWQSGQKLGVFLPIFWDGTTPHILVASVWGHSIDPKALSLKRIFIPSNAEMVDDEPVTSDVLMQFSRLAPLFIKGAYEQEKAKIDDKKAKGHLNDATYRQALNKLDKEYDIEDGRIRKNAAVGPLRAVISTEVVTVLYDDQGKPKADSTRLVTRDLSDKQIQKLYQIMSNPDVNLQPGDKFLEVTYTFGTTGDRKLDAQVDPQAVNPEYRISNRFPEDWVNIERTVDMLPQDMNTIIKRNSSYKKVGEREILSAISTYSVMNSELLDELRETDDIDRLKRNAQVLRDLEIPVTNEEIIAHIEELTAEEATIKKAEQEAQARNIANAIEERNEQAEAAPTLEQLQLKEDIEAAKQTGDETNIDEEIGLESGNDDLV